MTTTTSQSMRGRLRRSFWLCRPHRTGCRPPTCHHISGAAASQEWRAGTLALARAATIGSMAFRLPARRKLSARPELPRSAWLAAASIVRVGRLWQAGEGPADRTLGYAAQPLPSRLRHSAGKQGVAGWRDQLAAKGR
jgi:hypothetical protein